MTNLNQMKKIIYGYLKKLLGIQLIAIYRCARGLNKAYPKSPTKSVGWVRLRSPVLAELAIKTGMQYASTLLTARTV